MTIKTTTMLTLTWRDRTRLWLAQLDPLALISFVIVAGIVIVAVLRALVIASQPANAAVPTPQLPIIMIASPLPNGPPPTAVPVAAKAQLGSVTPRAIVVFGDHDLATAIDAVEAGRPYKLLARWGAEWLQVDVTGSGVVYVRTADLLNLPADLADLAPSPAPQYIVVNVPAAPENAPLAAVATPDATEYAITNQPPDDFYTTPPQIDPAFQQSLIGDDPNALACGGSPMCGGMTNAEAQAELDRQRAIREHYANDRAPLQPMEESAVTKEWARQQWLSEHPEAAR